MKPAPINRVIVIAPTIIFSNRSFFMIDKRLEFEIDDICEGQRIDVYFSEKLSISRAKVARKIRERCIFSKSGDDWVVQDKLSTRVKSGEVYRVESYISREDLSLEGEFMSLCIVYEDGDLLVLNKPAGLVVHPGAGNFSGTLVHGLIHKFGENLSSVGGRQRPGIVHRLDKDTSGLMVVAKNDRVHQDLSEQLMNRSMFREYQALVWGKFLKKDFRVEASIARDRKSREKFMVSEFGKSATSIFSSIKIFAAGKFSLIKCRLLSGRTHQIRVHLSHIGHEVVGDQVYGRRRVGKIRDNYSTSVGAVDVETLRKVIGFNRQALHAHKLRFIHPTEKKELEFRVEMPEDIKDLIDNLDFNGTMGFRK